MQYPPSLVKYCLKSNSDMQFNITLDNNNTPLKSSLLCQSWVQLLYSMTTLNNLKNNRILKILKKIPKLNIIYWILNLNTVLMVAARSQNDIVTFGVMLLTFKRIGLILEQCFCLGCVKIWSMWIQGKRGSLWFSDRPFLLNKPQPNTAFQIVCEFMLNYKYVFQNTTGWSPGNLQVSKVPESFGSLCFGRK